MDVGIFGYLFSLHKEYREVKRDLFAIIMVNLKIEARLRSP